MLPGFLFYIYTPRFFLNIFCVDMLNRYVLFLLFSCTSLPAFSQAIEFVRNDGQWAGPFRYKASTGQGDAFIAENSFTYLVGSSQNQIQMDEVKHGAKKSATLLWHAYRMHFDGAAPNPSIVGRKEQTWYYNYFFGKDPSKWHSEIHPNLALDYKGLYPGVDMHLSSESGNLKYDFILAPGTNPSVIRLRFEGLDGISQKEGNLILKTSVGDATEMRPLAYQYTDNGRKEIPCNYRLRDGVVTYDLPKGYDASLPLVIDPVVVFATFTGSTADNWGFTATYDYQGNFYGGGICAASGFPVSTGAFQTTFAGGTSSLGIPGDMAIIKYNASGTSRIWASYLGGSNLDQPHSMIVDTGGNLIIAGRTFSNDYPVSSSAYDGTFNGNADIVVTKINSSGTAILGSTYVGGSLNEGCNIYSDETTFGSLKYNYGDDARSEVIVDIAGNIYVAASSSSTDFPVTSNAYQNIKGAVQDAVFFKLNPSLSTLMYSTYIGGGGDDAAYVLALDRNQTHVYVGGGTNSSNFVGSTYTSGAWKTSYQGGSADGFIARFGNSGTYALQKVSYIGTNNYDQVYGVQVDLNNNVYAMGQSLGGAFPVTSGVYSNPGSTQFIIKMDSMLSSNIFSTVFGSGTSSVTNISPVAFLVDTCENIYISGWGGNLGIATVPSTVGTTNGMPVTAASIPSGSVLKSTTDGSDFYFMALSKNAVLLLFGAFYGRSSSTAFFGEHVDGGTSRFDRQGVIYQAICGGCGGSSGPPLPMTSGSFSTTNGSSNCNLASLKIAFQLSAPDAMANASPKTSGCPPLTVQFVNTSSNSIAYLWDFRDGSPTDTAFQPKHTFTTPGTYNVQLIVFNPNACKVRDTTYVQIIVSNSQITPDFTFVVTDSCGPFKANFTNKSVYSPLPGAAGRTKFYWDFGDATTFVGANPGSHTFPATGTYTVQLVMIDTASCNSPDTVTKVITFGGSRVSAFMDGPDSVCLKTPMIFQNTSTNATAISWNFGDGRTSTNKDTVVVKYATAGTYTIRLIAVNPATCNKADTFYKTVRIKKLPTADFVFAPVIPESNKPVTFTNTSKDASYYTWNFGDGSALTHETNPVHQFRRTGSFIVCLQAINNEGCADSICKKVDADIHTAIDLPTAFSPNGDGSNDILYIRGGGIETVSLMIFNRWGEKVFETSNMNIGWDGTYKGKLQEVDAYGYVLYATFIDGSSATKKGNVTLLR
jgi:gliding motility-associated-like protein